ncbi:hypothetical protein FMEXI_14073 [Fusarium mexicanum]|uniref:Azaphilone pigments biosynthesis cluster protein L N-terminal domain-containing protein n=1 Tax=Fusarium mexicanum TaxID=751941 RepID=A0A8H5MH90_9HYPO|nr:hypothetical protein FMEXI_14073 [Fusarium mexicanum]
METVGAGASILTFITVAFSVTQSIHSALSAIKDGPQVIRLLTDEIFQLKSILQRLDEVSFVSINDIDKSQLNGLAKKCKDDLSALNSRLKSLDVANSDGRGDRLWRKLKLSFSERDLDQVRHVVRGHVQHLTVRLNLIQVQQGSFTATQSTQILDLLQQLKQDISALQTTNTATLIAEEDSSTTSARVTEVDDEDMDCSPDTSLDDSINRLMRLIEEKPCVVQSDDSEELLKDIEHLLKCVRNDAEPVELEGTCQNCHPDVSKELKLMANIILSSPSVMINQTARLWRPTDKKLLISPERKRKTIETNDGIMTVTVSKRIRKVSSEVVREKAKVETRRDFVAKFTYTSKSTKKMLSLSVNQGQFLLNNFTSTLPCAMVCNILPENSLVFSTARSGSVQDLLKLFEGGEANIHDHDTQGWSLLHHSTRNLPVLKFLIEQGLDIDEVASSPNGDYQTTPSHLAIAPGVPIGNYEALLYAGADVTIPVRGLQQTAVGLLTNSDTALGFSRIQRTLHLSPFVYADPSVREDQNLIPNICVDCFLTNDSEPYQALQQIKLLVKHGYNVNSKFHGQSSLHLLLSSSHPWLKHIPEHVDLLSYLIDQGADMYAEDDHGDQPWHFAYGATCEACYLFCTSARGDLWDAVLTCLGYDIPQTRRYYPREARYITGYTRGDFERLWHGQEDKCPYWDDRLWPPVSEQSDTSSSPWLLTRGKLCEVCITCLGEYQCFNCGVCLSSLEFACDDLSHVHDETCPRERIATWELKEDGDEFCWKLVRFAGGESEYHISSSEDSDDGGILLQGGLEEEFSDDSMEELS